HCITVTVPPPATGTLTWPSQLSPVMVAEPAVSTSVAEDATRPGSAAARFCAGDLALLDDGLAVTPPSGFPVPAEPEGFAVGSGRLTEGTGLGAGDDDPVADGLDVGDGEGPRQMPRMQTCPGAAVAALACCAPVATTMPATRA